MYTITPKAGDKVRVRLPCGKAVDAKYLTKHPSKAKSHLVYFNGERFCVCSKTPKYPPFFLEDTLRFIYPLSLMPKPEMRK